MMAIWRCVLVVLSHYSVSTLAAPLKARYSNGFAVEVQGGRDKADEIAAKHGLANMGHVYLYQSSSMLSFLIDW